ncbi:MAG TPA: DNA polymerase III subunit delta [Paludibacteraceae bacterium]|nr:DNA polymerase III subunit delta [Paludibacteraceae bacterium]HRS67919.1 DNA polymerase III subunit delta [Paludibacteraceae bacterium]
MAKQVWTYEQLLASLKRKEYKPVYMLMGDESFYIDQISDYIEEHVLTEEEKAFNQTILYGKDTTLTDIIMAAKRYPMMSPYQVIIVKEAQHIKNFDDLQFYLEKPLNTTLLVFCYKYSKLDGRKKSTQEIEKKGILFESKKLYDNQVAGWIESYVKSMNISINSKAANMLAEYLGNDLTRIVHEVEKLLITKPKEQASITPELIERNIGISKDYNNFELVSALTNKDILKCNRIVDYFGKNSKNNPLVVTITVIFNFFSNLLLYHSLKDKSQMNVANELKINPYFVKDFQQAAKLYNSSKVTQVISDIRKADVQSKGFVNSSISDYDLLKELVFKILH